LRAKKKLPFNAEDERYLREGEMPIDEEKGGNLL